jgi:hypothetical protein
MNWDNFDIDDELKIRKKIESMLNYDIELQKTDDKYFWDISCFRYNTKTNQKTLLGYIELEHSDTWVDEYPSFWKYHSFLARKVFKFDWDKNEFLRNPPQLKDEWARTIYLIVNKNLTDMICQSINTISNLNFEYCNVKDNYYNDCYLRINKKNKTIICGENKCKKFIKDYFEIQRILDEFT